MPPVTRLYFDTNILLSAGWPRSSPQLNQVINLSRGLKIALCLPELVRGELEAGWARKTLDEWNGTRGAAERLRNKVSPKFALPEVPKPPTPAELVSKIRADTETFTSAFEIIPNQLAR